MSKDSGIPFFPPHCPTLSWWAHKTLAERLKDETLEITAEKNILKKTLHMFDLRF